MTPSARPSATWVRTAVSTAAAAMVIANPRASVSGKGSRGSRLGPYSAPDASVFCRRINIAVPLCGDDHVRVGLVQSPYCQQAAEECAQNEQHEAQICHHRPFLTIVEARIPQQRLRGKRARRQDPAAVVGDQRILTRLLRKHPVSLRSRGGVHHFHCQSTGQSRESPVPTSMGPPVRWACTAPISAVGVER